jgi:hypothetical protein
MRVAQAHDEQQRLPSARPLPEDPCSVAGRIWHTD